jgi:DNA-binding NarL/FixJ family response regulator
MEELAFRILVVDDSAPFRQFVLSKLCQRPEWQVVGEASDGLEAVHKAAEFQPDLIVLDIGLPTMNGIEAARRIREFAPEPKILFLSQESSADVVQEALSLGALGYVVKELAGAELLVAVQAILQGKQFVSVNPVDQVFIDPNDKRSSNRSREDLTPSPEAANKVRDFPVPSSASTM